MAIVFGVSNDYLINSPGISTSLQKYSLWAKARKDGNRFLNPSLDLDFAGNKSLIDNVSGSNLVTFSRSSNATFIDSNGNVGIATTNTPRFDHDPITRECRGLLIEEARTNFHTYSTEFSTQWTLGGTGNGNLTPNSTTAPDGTITASKLNGDFTRYMEANANTGGNITGPWSGTFNLNTMTTSFTGSFGGYPGHTGGIISYQNGWYRIYQGPMLGQIFSIFVKPAESNIVKIVNNVNNTKIYVDGNASSGIYVWGAQWEFGSFPTSYIPTSGSTVTRSADNASITGTNFSSWYNQSEGTVYFVGSKYSDPRQNFYALSDGTNNNRISVYYLGSSVISYIASPSGGFDQSSYTTSSPLSTRYCIGYSSGNTTPSIDGSFSTTITESSIPTNNRLNIGQSEIGTFPLSGYISRFTYWPTRLPNANLQLITQ